MWKLLKSKWQQLQQWRTWRNQHERLLSDLHEKYSDLKVRLSKLERKK